MSAARKKILRVSESARMAAHHWAEVPQLVEDVGGISAAAQAIGVTRQSLSAWLSGAGPSDVVKLGVAYALRFALVQLAPWWPDREDDSEEEVVA